MYDRRLLTELELSVRSKKNKRQRRPDRMTTEIESVESIFLYWKPLVRGLQRTSDIRISSSRNVSFYLIVVEHKNVLAEGIKRKIYFGLFKKDTECTTAEGDTNYAYNSCFTVNNCPYCQVEARGPCRRVLSLYNDLDPTNGVTANAHTAFTIHRSLATRSAAIHARLQHVCTLSVAGT